MFFDLPLDVLKTYQPEIPEPSDFDAFWEKTIKENQQFPLDAVFKEVDYGLSLLKVYDVVFRGYGGHKIKAWFMVPRAANWPIPCVVEFIGYGGGRGFPVDWLLYPNAGFATLVMDTRGQGSSWLKGDTPDRVSEGVDPHFPGFMTIGIRDKEEYYYRRVYVDAVRAICAARSSPMVDSGMVALTGRSQGGGIAIAASALSSDIAMVLSDVPFLCNFERAVATTDENPYFEITRYLRAHRSEQDQVFQTLSYFDCVHFAKRSRAQALFSVGLMDNICPPSTVFSAYNHYQGKKEIKVYPFNLHDGGGSHQDILKIDLLRTIWN